MRRLAIALLHHPMLGRHGETLTTTITNLDIHDMSRSARTYGLCAFYIVHPLSSQRMLAERICKHWVEGAGGRRIPDRAEALRLVHVVADLDAAKNHLAPAGEPVKVWVTAAAATRDVFAFEEARTALADHSDPVLLCFGTGWGMPPELLSAADQQLAPIAAAQQSGFNHLSVRAACAITLDRLVGPPR